MEEAFKESLAKLVSNINHIELELPYRNKIYPPPVSTAKSILDRIGFLMFPRLLPIKDGAINCQNNVAQSLYLEINDCLQIIGISIDIEAVTMKIISEIPKVKSKLVKDAIAIFEGDPAAVSVEEIIICYPGFLATMIYRIANVFYQSKIPYFPRMMAEIAHERTGVDIHPGARIGESLCIDHGTGIVIGETAEIGDRVKIYQGVTIGAKSFASDGEGRLIRGEKRHPTIGNDCIIYAGATILGGDTVIGDGCIIGGNVWLTHSLPPRHTVYYREK